MRAVKYGIRLDKDRLPYLVKEMSHNYKGRNACSPDRIIEILREIEEADSLVQEKFWMFCLDSGMKIIGYFELFAGSRDRCLVDRAHLYTCALSTGASHIVVAHNHPSGDPSPSKRHRPAGSPGPWLPVLCLTQGVPSGPVPAGRTNCAVTITNSVPLGRCFCCCVQKSKRVLNSFIIFSFMTFSEGGYMRIVITRSWSIYRIDEKRKRIRCKKHGLDRHYAALHVTSDNHLKIVFSENKWMQTREILFKF